MGHMANNYDEDNKALTIEEEMANAIDEAPKTDDEEADLADSYKLPDDDLIHESLDSKVIPKKTNEFTCKICHLVFHKRNMSRKKSNIGICVDCEED